MMLIHLRDSPSITTHPTLASNCNPDALCFHDNQQFWSVFYSKHHCSVSQTTQEEWRSVFFLSSALLVASALTFVLFGEDGIADWAKEQQEFVKVEGEITEYAKDKEWDQKNDCSCITGDNIVTKF